MCRAIGCAGRLNVPGDFNRQAIEIAATNARSLPSQTNSLQPAKAGFVRLQTRFQPPVEFSL
jgi:hypothetical protein